MAFTSIMKALDGICLDYNMHCFRACEIANILHLFCHSDFM